MTYRIMIFEDESITAYDLQCLLEDNGYCVLGILADGGNCQEYVKNADPDCILMDIHLKGRLDGYSIANIIRKSKKVPIVFTSAYVENKLDDLKKTEIDDYIQKPYNEEELLKKIECFQKVMGT